MSAMHCLHVKGNMAPSDGGSARAVAELCNAAALVGDTCEIATLAYNRRDASSPIDGLDPCIRVRFFVRSWPRRVGNSWSMARWLCRVISRFDIVEIHEIFSAASLIAAMIAYKRGVPYLVRPHGSLDPFDLRKHRIWKRVLAPIFRWALLEHAAAVVFTSDLELLRSNTFGAHPPRYSSALPIQPLRPGHRSDFRRRVGIRNHEFVVLFLSRVDYKKGLFSLLEAIYILHRQGEQIILVIAGDGDPDYVAKVRAAVDDLELTASVRFVGFVRGHEKEDAFAGADVFCLPSDNENFGIAIIEALYARLPAIISDQVYIAPELAQEGAALVVERTGAAIAGAVRELIRDPARRSRLSSSGASTAKSLCEPGVVALREQRLRHQLTAHSLFKPQSQA